MLLACACWAQTEDSSFQRGAALYRAGDCHGAVPLLDRALNATPRAALLLSQCLFESQQFEKAVELLSAYQRSHPGSEAAILLARAQERAGHTEAALATLSNFLKASPGEASVRTAQAGIYVRLGRTAEASAEFQAVLREDPSNPGAQIGLGLVALREKKYQAAIDQLDKVRPEVPDDARVLTGIGSAYAALNNCERAADPLRQALDLTPDDYPLAKQLAVCDVKLKRWSAVLGALRTGSIEESRDEEATRMVVDAYSASADLTGAEAYCRWAIIATPANLTAHLSLANLLYTTKRVRSAYAEYAEVVKLKPDSPDVRERMGDISMDQKDPSDARTQYEIAARSSDTARLKLARLCLASDDLKCVTQAVSAVTTPSLLTQAKTLRARVEYKSEHWEQAGALANEALAGDPENTTLLRIAADAAVRRNQPVAAAGLYERALKIEPTGRDLVYRLAALYANFDELKDRLPSAAAMLTSFPDKDAEGYLLLGSVYRKMGDLENAKLNFKAGFDRIRPPIPPSLAWAYTAYGALLYEEKQFDEAYRYETQAVQLNPNDDASQYALALACLELGKTEELNAARDRLASMNSPHVAALDAQIEARKGKP